MKDESEVDTRYYESKKEELNSLLSMANSRTMKELITEALERTDDAVNDLVATQKVVVLYLKAHVARSRKKAVQYDKDIQTIRKGIYKYKEAPLKKEDYIGVMVLSNAYEALTQRLGTEADLNEITHGVHRECSEALTDSLLEYIFKYSRKNFNPDRINEVFNYFLESKIPGLGEMKLVLGMPQKARQNKMVKDGDELATYLEQYCDVLEKWSYYCNEYMKLLVSDPADLVMPD